MYVDDMKRLHSSVDIRGPGFELSLSPVSLVRVWDGKGKRRALRLLVRPTVWRGTQKLHPHNGITSVGRAESICVWLRETGYVEMLRDLPKVIS